MRRRTGLIASLGCVCAAGLLGGCAVQPPTGPTVMALPAPGKSLASFQRDDYDCRNYASQAIAYQVQGATRTNPGATGAALGTLGGAALGAAFGAIGGNAGAGAAIGAGTGLIGGTAVGANRAAASEYSLQQNYNIAYTQCMYARGNSVRSPPPGFPYGYYQPPPYPYPIGYPYAVGAYPFFPAPAIVVAGGEWGWHGGGWHH